MIASGRNRLSHVARPRPAPCSADDYECVRIRSCSSNRDGLVELNLERTADRPMVQSDDLSRPRYDLNFLTYTQYTLLQR